MVYYRSFRKHLRSISTGGLVAMAAISLGLGSANAQPLTHPRVPTANLAGTAESFDFARDMPLTVKIPGTPGRSITIPPELLELSENGSSYLNALQRWRITAEDAVSAAAIAADYLGDQQSVEAALTTLSPTRANEVRHTLATIHNPVATPNFDDPSTTIVVLGNGLDESGRVHPELAARLKGGLVLARQHPSVNIIVTGGNTGYGYNEAEAMSNWLVRHGLSPQRIIKEENAWSTISNAWLSQQVLDSHGISPSSLVVVTSEYHIHRGVVDYCLAFGPDVNISGLGTRAETDLSDAELRNKTYRDAVAWYMLPDAVKADGLPPFFGQNPDWKPATEPDH